MKLNDLPRQEAHATTTPQPTRLPASKTLAKLLAQANEAEVRQREEEALAFEEAQRARARWSSD